jgi:hypothetical protein
MKALQRSCISKTEALGFPFKTYDPFLFTVYHKDSYPAGNAKMEVPGVVGNGADFNPKAPYRMYHGERIPGFPQHPHVGFETFTATIDGLIDHTDSKGNAGRYGQGDTQHMTAGSGIIHGEMFPLLNQDKPNPCRFFQVWINLPAAKKKVEPAFVMHWHEDIPVVYSADRLTKATVWAGTLLGATSLPPTPNSWLADSANEVGIWFITMQPGARFTLPAAAGGDAVNRALYWVEGAALTVADQRFTSPISVVLRAGQPADLHNSGSTPADLLVLQGKPIGEPVAHQGPFVMNTQAELRQAFDEYRRTQFGGWPWQDDAVVFPRDKGRFSLLNGVESFPPVRPSQPDL